MTPDGTYAPVADPQSGWPVWGQPQAVGDLRQAVEGQPRHAWILAGPTGSGKMLAARTFARALCCPHTDGSVACGRCSICRRIDRGVFPDVTEFSLQRQIERDGDKSRNLTLNVATVREVASTVSFRPTEARWKIAIVQDAESMQETAQEAFLKTLEEPPANAVILLLTADLEPILPTVQSRCSIVRFGAVPGHEVERALIAAGVPSVDASGISAAADGNVGWAFRAANDGALLEHRQQEMAEARSLVAGSTYDQLVSCFQLADEFGRDRETVFRRLALIQRVWRDEMSVALSTGSDISAVQRAVRAIRAIDRCMINLEANVRPRLALEAMVTSWHAPMNENGAGRR